ncbi:MAG: J domain-containing protein [Pseudomonadota bacterium]
MFDRNAVDTQTTRAHRVALTLVDDTTLIGTINVAITRSLADEVNAVGPFLHFAADGSEAEFVAKSQIAGVRIIGQTRTDQLERRLEKLDTIEPQRLLGVGPDADLDAIKAAYHARLRGYHPDKFGDDVPAEVLDYINAVAKKLNTAYALLIQEKRAKARAEERVAAGLRPEPIRPRTPFRSTSQAGV